MELLNINKLNSFFLWLLLNYIINITSSNFHFLKKKNIYRVNANLKEIRVDNYCNILYKRYKNFILPNIKKINKGKKKRKRFIFQYIFDNVKYNKNNLKKDDKQISIFKKYSFQNFLKDNDYLGNKIYSNNEQMKINNHLNNNQLSSVQEDLDNKLSQKDSDNFNKYSKSHNNNINNLKNYEKKIKKINIHSILLCGGIGKRVALDTPKQFLKLNDIPLFIYSFNLFIKCNLVKTITIVCDSKYFEYVIDNINLYNPLLLKRKIENNFLYNNSNVINIENKKIDNESTCDNIEFNEKVDKIHDFLKKNEYIIYDNEKNKCIFNMEELLHDISKNKKDMQNYPNPINKNNRKRKKVIKIKLKNINANRYKLIRLIQSGKERLDSFVNATKNLDINLNIQIYIYKLIKNYVENEEQYKSNYQFKNLKEKYNNYTLLNNYQLNKDTEKKRRNYITNISIHDGARPFLSEFDFFKLIYYSSLDKNVILGIKATDTIKLIKNEKKEKENNNTSYLIKKTIKRENVFQAQTPQIFDSKKLLSILPFFFPDKIKYKKDKKKEYNLKNKQFTDSSSLFQYLTKKKVYVLQSNFINFKITTPSDIFQSIFLMNYIYNFKHLNTKENILKSEYMNSDLKNTLTNQFNNFFYYDSLNEKQKILYHNFYYK